MTKKFQWLAVVGFLFFAACPVRADEGLISMNFRNTDIDSVLNFLSDVSGMAVVKDPGIKDRISVTTLKDVSIGEAIQVLNSALSVKGYTLLKSGNLLKVVELSDISQHNIELLKEGDVLKGKEDDEVVTKIVTLKYGNTEKIAQTIQSMVSSFGSVIPYERTNTLILNDSVANVRRLIKLIEQLDQGTVARKTKSYPIRFADVRHVGDILGDIAKQYEQEMGEFTISVDERTRAIFITTLPENFERIEAVLHQLDKSIAQIILEVDVIQFPLRNIHADIKYRLFSSTNSDKVHTPTLLEDTLINWKYNVSVDKTKLFSWAGFSPEKDKRDLLGIIYAYYGRETVKLTAKPMLLTSDNADVFLSLGREERFGKLTDFNATFRIVPHITEDQHLSLEIYQNITGGGMPPKEAFVNVLLNDGQTMVLGGLDDYLQSDRPGDLNPLEDSSEQASTDQFLIMITPSIIWDAQTLQKKIEKNQKKHKELQKKEDLNLLFPSGFMEVIPPHSSGGLEDKKEPYQVMPESLFKNQDVEAEESKERAPEEEPFSLSMGKEAPKETLTDSTQMKVIMDENPAVNTFVNEQARDKLKEPERFSKPPAEDLSKDLELAEPVADSGSAKSTAKEGYILKEVLYRRGIEFYKKRQFKGAIREFAPIMSIDPNYKKVERYMQLAQKKFQAQIVEEQDARNKRLVEERAKREKAITEVNQNLDQQLEEYLDAHPADAYDERARDSSLDPVQKISGRLIQVSQTHPFVVIDRGSAHRVQEGLIFRVYRDDELIGKVSISDVDESISGAQVISKKDPNFAFREGDLVIQAEN